MACRVVIFSITIICLAALLYSFKFVKLSPYQQENSKLTGFPVWHGALKDQERQNLVSATWAPIILILGSTIASLTFAFKKSIKKHYISHFIFPDYPTSHNPPSIKTKSFNKSLAYYTLFTFITSLTFSILEPGKLWSSFSSFHNLLELIIILFLSLEGQFHKNKFGIFFTCSTYMILVNLLTVFLKWPLDNIWFKAQGLMLDFALVIIFTRISLHTYFYINDQKRLQLPTNNTTNNTTTQGDQEEATVTINKQPKFINHPSQVFLLPCAALIHMIGSAAITLLVKHTIGNMAFILSNAVAFPMYSFYIYLDIHYTTNTSNSKNIVLPHTPTWKLALIILWSIILTALTIRITLLF